MPPTEAITRRNLPHWYVPGAVHFVTYRLADTIPIAALQRLRRQRDGLLGRPAPKGVTLYEHKARAHKLFFAAYDRFLDCGGTIDWLAAPAVAAAIRGSLHYHNAGKYRLLAYCVMPNHVHALFQPSDPIRVPEPREAPLGDECADALSPLAGIMHSLKSYTAHKANGLLGRSGQFWQHESYDHWVRNDDEVERIVNYIAWNPVKANLARRPHDWFFSSAHDRFLQDGAETGCLI